MLLFRDLVSLWNVTMVFLVWPCGRGLVAEQWGWLGQGVWSLTFMQREFL